VRARAQLVRIERFECLARDVLRRHQAVADECLHQIVLAQEPAIAPPAHLTGEAAIGGERRSRLWIAPVGEQPHAKIADARRLALVVERNRAPAK
jgi:hypothetical protein